VRRTLNCAPERRLAMLLPSLGVSSLDLGRSSWAAFFLAWRGSTQAEQGLKRESPAMRGFAGY